MGGPWDHEAALDIGATVDFSQGLEAGEGEGLGCGGRTAAVGRQG